MSPDLLNRCVLTRLGDSSIDPADPENSVEIIAACRGVAEEAGLTLASARHPDRDGTTDCDHVEQYVDRRGHAVNLWIVDVRGVGFAAGGLGFD